MNSDIPLSEIYFYITIVIYLLVSLFILTTAEDVKDSVRYKKHQKFTFRVGTLGILIELIDWNYLCNFQCILITFSPFITLLLIKFITIFSEKTFKKPFYQSYRRKLSDGFWVKNKGDLKYINQYEVYSIFLIITPIITIGSLFVIIEKFFC